MVTGFLPEFWDKMEKKDFNDYGTLFVVSTPIGNLEDITLRALRVLKEVDLIACEDTRRTHLLLKHYNIKNSLTSYHDYNKERKTPELVRFLKSKKSLALVSDAGTPGIADPAYFLVKKAIFEKIEVVSVPGVSAFLSALVVSGLPTDRFCFENFLPSKKTKRGKRLKGLEDEKRTLIFYESSHRFIQTLDDIQKILGERDIVVARELTKKFEEIKRGKVSEIKEYFQKKKIKGEFVILMRGKG